MRKNFFKIKDFYSLSPFVFLLGIFSIIFGWLCGPEIDIQLLGAGTDKTLMLIKIELLAFGFFLLILGYWIYQRRYNLSKIIEHTFLFIPILIYLGLGFWQIWVTDDAFITFRAVRNFLTGFGPVFNIGERVEVYTHPLWFGILALWAFLIDNIEIGSAWMGIIFSVAGLYIGQLGAQRYFQRRINNKKVFFVPFGSIAIVCLPPFWDFASSGLETGLGFFWLGSSFFLLVSSNSNTKEWKERCKLIWFSLGPLIRPDFVIFYAGFVLLALWPTLRYSFKKKFYLGIFALILPVSYQIFRMGYFACLYPNTALAKSALTSYWSQGLIYLLDFVLPYKLYIPIFFFIIALILIYSHNNRFRDSKKYLDIPLVLWSMGILYGFLVVRCGGDFMHARFLLPVFFAIQLPICCVPLYGNLNKKNKLLVPIFISLIFWGLWCGIAGRTEYDCENIDINSGNIFKRIERAKSICSADSITDERGFYSFVSANPNPIFLSDYLGDSAVFSSKDKWKKLALKSSQTRFNKKSTGSLYSGLLACFTGPIDYSYTGGGLASPVGSRFIVVSRGLPGHEKNVPESWMLGRFSAKTQNNTYLLNFTPNKYNLQYTNLNRFKIKSLLVDKVLESSHIKQLLHAIHAPLSVSQFFKNILYAYKSRNLTIPKNPLEAMKKFCTPLSNETRFLLNFNQEDILLPLKKNINDEEQNNYICFLNKGKDINQKLNNLKIQFIPLGNDKFACLKLIIKDHQDNSYIIEYHFSQTESYHNEQHYEKIDKRKALVKKNVKSLPFSCKLGLPKELSKVFGSRTLFSHIDRICLESKTQYIKINQFVLD